MFISLIDENDIFFCWLNLFNIIIVKENIIEFVIFKCIGDDFDINYILVYLIRIKEVLDSNGNFVNFFLIKVGCMGFFVFVLFKYLNFSRMKEKKKYW